MHDASTSSFDRRRASTRYDDDDDDSFLTHPPSSPHILPSSTQNPTLTHINGISTRVEKTQIVPLGHDPPHERGQESEQERGTVV